MSQFTPEWKVTVNGSELTGVTVANVIITSGRLNIYEQAKAGYANIQLIVLDGQTYALDINDSVSIQLKDSAGTFVPIFGGFLVESSIEVGSIGATGYSQRMNLLALGALARLPRYLTEGVLSKDFDGNQIYSILSDVLFQTWAEVPAGTKWADVSSSITWADAFNAGLGTIDQPGNYELTARSSSTTDIYSLISSLATSGLGYIYEDAQGRISYADSTHRSAYLSTNGYVYLSASSDALGQGLRIATRGGDVRNYITITYKANAQVTASDAESIQLYGQLAQNIPTSLENLADATSQAAFYLTLRANPRGYLEQITFQLANDSISDADRDALINVFMGMPVSLSGLPSNMGSVFEGFIEGWTWQAGYNSLALTCNLSPLSFSLQAMTWNDVGVLETWSTITNTLTWEDALIVN